MVFQFWLGEISDIILDCLNVNMSIFGTDNYVLVSNVNFLNAKNFISVDIFKDGIYNKLKTPSEISNYIRLKVLLQNPDWMYVDADCKFNQDISNLFNQGVWFGQYQQTSDAFILKPNGDKKYIDTLLKYYLKMGFYGRGCLYKLVRGQKNIIPNTYYIHLENHNE
jgi:hypothetical protein